MLNNVVYTICFVSNYSSYYSNDRMHLLRPYKYEIWLRIDIKQKKNVSQNYARSISLQSDIHEAFKS